MRNGEWVPAVFLLVLALFICQRSFVIGTGTLREPGPGLMALGAGLVMAGLALALLVQSFLSKEIRKESAEPRTALKGAKLMALSVSLFVYTIGVNHLGFLLSTFLFVAFVLFLVETKKWWRVLLEAALITAGNYVLFVVWLGLSLPAGFLQR